MPQSEKNIINQFQENGVIYYASTSIKYIKYEFNC